jgi:hypothetical protein
MRGWPRVPENRPLKVLLVTGVVTVDIAFLLWLVGVAGVIFGSGTKTARVVTEELFTPDPTKIKHEVADP